MRCALRELPCPLHPADDQVGHPSRVDLLTLAQALAPQKAALPNIHQNFVPILNQPSGLILAEPARHLLSS